MPTQEEFDALQQRCNDLDAANLKNQQGWDAEIQGRKEDAAAHDNAIADAKDQMAAAADKHKQALSDLQEACNLQIANYKVAHEQVVAILAEPADARALRVQQAQELADYTAKQEAARAELAKKLGK